MQHFIALRGVLAHTNVTHLQNRYNFIHRDQSHDVEIFLQLENKQQIMENNVETQHKHMYSLVL